MSANTKAFRSGKLKSKRRLYVSSRIDATIAGHDDWMERFWLRLSNAAHQKGELFAAVNRTGDGRPGDLIDARNRELDIDSPLFTDFVAILTDIYLSENMGARAGELARAIERVKEHFGQRDPELPQPQVFLAPVDPPDWTYKIRDVPLSHSMLVRLRESQFTWPSDPTASQTVSREIAEAVDFIIGRCSRAADLTD